jgi:hypothetical protein
MLLTDLDELELGAMEIEAIDFSVERLSAKFGAGYRADASVGAGHELWGWEITSDCLTDDDAYSDLIDGVPSFEYYANFIRDHTIGGESNIFVIDFRGKKYTAAFADNDFAGVMHTYDLFGLSGVRLEYARVAGVMYDTDGSISQPWVLLLAESFTDAEGTAETLWSDETTNNRDFTLSGGPTLRRNDVHDLAAVRFDGSNDFGSITFTGTRRFYDIFIVMKHRGATWGALNLKVLSDDTFTYLQGASGAANFTDLSLANYEYRKNGTLLADNGASPMNRFAVLHLRFTSGRSFANAIGIAKSIGEGYNTPVDIAAVEAWPTPLSTTDYEAQTDALLARYDGLINEPWGCYKASEISASDGATLTTWADLTTNGNDLTLSGGPTFQESEIDDGLSVVRFDGVDDYASRTLASPVTLYDIFVVIRVNAATWGGLARVLLSDNAANYVTGDSGTNHLEDLAIAGFEYRKNGTLLTDAGATPMNVFAVLHFRFTSGQAFTGAIGFAKSLAAGYNSPVDIAQIDAYDRLLSSDEFAAKATELMEEYTLS